MILEDAGIIKRKWLDSFDILVTTREGRIRVVSAQKTEIIWRKIKEGGGTLRMCKLKSFLDIATISLFLPLAYIQPT